jgi:ArsR family transcriptional regulator, arsenate/arsenite/antimonite-responsive transcriptional repressor / arsenate reductase (thioredoxin)
MDDELSLSRRALAHRALADEHRLAMVDALRLGDHTPSRLAELTGLGSNLVAFHLDVLEEAGLVRRSRSQGDARRRYVGLRPGVLADLVVRPGGDLGTAADRVLFVCTRNAARSPLAAGLWRRRTGRPALSAGHRPAARVHELTRRVAEDRGLELDDRGPRDYADVVEAPDLVVSVCDRAHEVELPFDAPRLHWSVPDPLEPEPTRSRVEEALAELDRRVEELAAAVVGT